MLPLFSIDDLKFIVIIAFFFFLIFPVVARQFRERSELKKVPMQVRYAGVVDSVSRNFFGGKADVTRVPGKLRSIELSASSVRPGFVVDITFSHSTLTLTLKDYRGTLHMKRFANAAEINAYQQNQIGEVFAQECARKVGGTAQQG